MRAGVQITPICTPRTVAARRHDAGQIGGSARGYQEPFASFGSWPSWLRIGGQSARLIIYASPPWDECPLLPRTGSSSTGTVRDLGHARVGSRQPRTLPGEDGGWLLGSPSRRATRVLAGPRKEAFVRSRSSSRRRCDNRRAGRTIGAGAVGARRIRAGRGRGGIPWWARHRPRMLPLHRKFGQGLRFRSNARPATLIARQLPGAHSTSPAGMAASGEVVPANTPLM